MSYNILYGKHIIKRVVHRTERKINGKYLLVIIICAVFLFTILSIIKSENLQFFIPGNTQVTQAALDNMVSDIKTGESLGDALTTFCQEIINNAYISE